MAQYDAFADFYNRDWGKDYHLQLMSVLEKLLLKKLAPGDEILDVGCGTGAVAAQLMERGFSVTGIDQSNAMLEFARRNAPGAKFFQADAASFQLPVRCKASIATFEAMNHLLEEDELAASFRHIAEHTDRVFVFDMLRELAYEVFWVGENTVEHDGLSCRFTSTYDPVSRMAICRTEVGGQTTEIRERYYDAPHVETLLYAAGFREVKCYDAIRELGMWGDAAVGRYFYQCFR